MVPKGSEGNLHPPPFANNCSKTGSRGVNPSHRGHFCSLCAAGRVESSLLAAGDSADGPVWWRGGYINGKGNQKG